jgi:hypothetical protein
MGKVRFPCRTVRGDLHPSPLICGSFLIRLFVLICSVDIPSKPSSQAENAILRFSLLKLQAFL